MTGDDLLLMRRAVRMTQATLAKALGVSRQTIVNWERNVHRIPLDKVPAIAAACGAPGASETSKAEAKMIREAVAHYTSMRRNPAGTNSHEWARDAWLKFNYTPPEAVQEAIGKVYPDSIGNW